MNDRAKEIIGLMNNLLKRARELTAEHKGLMVDFDKLQQELDQINVDEEKERNGTIN